MRQKYWLLLAILSLLGLVFVPAKVHSMTLPQPQPAVRVPIIPVITPIIKTPILPTRLPMVKLPTTNGPAYPRIIDNPRRPLGGVYASLKTAAYGSDEPGSNPGGKTFDNDGPTAPRPVRVPRGSPRGSRGRAVLPEQELLDEIGVGSLD